MKHISELLVPYKKLVDEYEKRAKTSAEREVIPTVRQLMLDLSYHKIESPLERLARLTNNKKKNVPTDVDKK